MPVLHLEGCGTKVPWFESDKVGVVFKMMTNQANSPADHPRAHTIAELKASGWESRPVRAEIRENVAKIVSSGEPLETGLVGYEDTVIPQLANALLAGHDVILLGERGQAKTRIMRSLVSFLDEWMPVVSGSEINDDPYNPLSKHARDLIGDMGEATPISWVHRSRRFAEKLATPDTSIADLVGEVDPIKVAEGRYLSDELTIHYGMIPRANRGIFGINELPDLAERIQVGLLNVLSERDVQIRGYSVRLPLDVMLVASANPEDYTNRGRIITPLKDRFGSQIRTHYPRSTQEEAEIMLAESKAGAVVPNVVLSFMTNVVARISQEARSSAKISQRSGVSVRVSVSNYEIMVANAQRRSLSLGEDVAVPRVSDLGALFASMSGKLEFDTFEEYAEEAIIAALVHEAVLKTFRTETDPAELAPLVEWFGGGKVVNVGDDIASSEYRKLYTEIVETPELESVSKAIERLTEDPSSDAQIASAIELVLEGLYLTKRLSKETSGTLSTFRARR